MQTKEYKTIDKSTWEDGPWKDEPDKVQYEDEETGLPCLIVRNLLGGLCRYVGISAEHPAYKQHYFDLHYKVHGGLTFTDFCKAGLEEKAICHIPEEGESDKVWWVGFDCGHSCDALPHPDCVITSKRGTYKDINYVKNEIKQLARQIKEDE